MVDHVTVTLAILLFINALWNFIVWPRFFQRVAKDPRSRTSSGKATTYLIVHTVLVGVSLLIAVVSTGFGVIALTTL